MSGVQPPIAVIVDHDELDPGPGRRILEDAGFEVRVVAGGRTPPVDGAASRVTALVIGFTRN